MQTYYPFLIGLGFGFVYVFLFDGRDDLKDLKSSRKSIITCLLLSYLIWSYFQLPLFHNTSHGHVATNWIMNSFGAVFFFASSLFLFGLIKFPKRKNRIADSTFSYPKALFFSFLGFYNFRFIWWWYNANLLSLFEWHSQIATLYTICGFTTVLIFGLIQKK